jgi:glucose/arabinose dehydrogenase
MHTMRFTLALALALASTAVAQDYRPTPVDLPESAYEGKLRVPRGLAVTEFAKVPGARAMAVGPDGAVYVSLPRRGEIVRLIDANQDGVADSQDIAVAGLNRPHGMAFRDGWLYIANTDGVVRLRLGADGRAQGTLEKLNSYSAMGGHWTRSILFGADGAMYVSIGSTCNVCEEQSPDRAAVMRYDANGQNGRLFSSGLRNAVGMALHQGTGQVWVTQHERDNLRPNHQDLPPEEINILREGAHYGWPYCHSNRVPNPEFNDAARCTTTEPPALGLQAHSAPLGITFLDRATLLPAEYRGDALVAFHGSWNRDEPTGAKVVRIRVRDGRPVGYEDFMVGWQNAAGQRWGRPVDVVVHRDGSLLVSDDQAGLILRVAPRR